MPSFFLRLTNFRSQAIRSRSRGYNGARSFTWLAPTKSRRSIPKKSSDSTNALCPVESSVPNKRCLRLHLPYHQIARTPEVQFTSNDSERQGVKRKRGSRKNQRLEAACDGLTDSKAGSSETKFNPTYKKLKVKLPSKVSNNVEVVGSLLRDQAYKVGDNIEVLSQDSGLRGCWFRCKVLKTSEKHLKVQYVDLRGALDESVNLEEWVPAGRVAAPDKLGIRRQGRLTVRPWPPQVSLDCSTQIAAVVDAWWCNGWWEGVVLEVDSSEYDGIQVYVHGDDRVLTVRKEDARVSRDWINGTWVELEATSQELCRIPPSVSSYKKLNLALAPGESSFSNNRSQKPLLTYHRRIRRTPEVQLTCDDSERRLEAKHKPTDKKLETKFPGGVSNNVDVVKSHLFGDAYKVGDKIEILSQDSGIRGCWFRCKVLKTLEKHLKVQYVDLRGAVDESVNLEEWVPAARVAAPDKLGIRRQGRLTVRPWPPQIPLDGSVKTGAVVDAWWPDRWWEGVVLEGCSSECDTIQVYIPGEDRVLTVLKKDARASRDWINGKWVELEATSDELSRIPSSVRGIESNEASPDKKVNPEVERASGC